jgi:polysaccharide biosynthesis transport protein
MENENLPVVSVNDGAAVRVSQDVGPMSESEAASPPQSGIGIFDILFMLFRHKWKIVVFGLAGIIVAGVVYLLVPPAYESEAKLLVRYVMDRSAVDGVDTQIKTPTPENETLLNSEVEILTSSDLLREVAKSLGLDKLGLGSDAGIQNAVDTISRSLDVNVVKETNIISVAYRSSDQSLPMPVVNELVKRYFDKHLEVHRSTGAFNFVAQETADLKKKLADTEAELKQLKDSVGIISLTEAKADLASEFGKTQQELDSAIADLAAQQARVKDLEKSFAVSANQAETAVQPLSGDTIEQYKSLIARLTQLQKAQSDLLLKYTAENPIVRVKSAQIADLEKQRGQLEKQYPALITSAAFSSQSGQEGQMNIGAERAVLAGIESKVAALKTRTSDLQARSKTISQVAPRIEELERKAEVEETNYKHSEASLEKARIDETLDPSRMPNISVVQTPLPAVRVKRNVAKAILGIAGGGCALGLGIAFVIELILDQSVKRSVELEKRLRVPLLLTIPYVGPTRAQLRFRDAENLALANGDVGREISVADSRGELLKPFCEAIRDRLSAFFEVNNMSYKPKLVAVTSLEENAGASTLAAGLASALSEISEGKVLLVDKPVSAKAFYNMLTEFKRSDFDYVVFDLPCLGDTSATLPLARFMDTMLLVVEAGKSNRYAVKRAYTQLAAKTNVSVVFNKSRSYGPKWLEGEI